MNHKPIDIVDVQKPDLIEIEISRRPRKNVVYVNVNGITFCRLQTFNPVTVTYSGEELTQ